MTPESLSDVTTEIKSIVYTFWTNYQRPILLSVLGGSLSKSAKLQWNSTGLKLAELTRQYLFDDIRLVPVMRHGFAAAPRSSTATLTDEELDSRLPLPNEDTSSKRNTFLQPSVWNVFLGQSNDRRAFVELCADGKVEVHLLDEVTEPQGGWYAITPEDIPPVGSEPAVVGGAIRTWCLKVGISIERLEIPKTHKSSDFSRSAINPHSGIQSHNDLSQLVKGLSVLSSSELARIQIPADILVDLLSRSIV